MTYEDAVNVVEMLLSAFPNERAWDAHEIRSYAEGIQRIDAAVATKTVVRCRDTISRRPSVSDFLSIARSVEAGMRTEPAPAPREKTNPRDLPDWVRRWVVARREGDFRRLREQGDWADPRTPLVPDDLYVDQAKGITTDDALSLVGAEK